MTLPSEQNLLYSRSFASKSCKVLVIRKSGVLVYAVLGRHGGGVSALSALAGAQQGA